MRHPADLIILYDQQKASLIGGRATAQSKGTVGDHTSSACYAR
jgi:hypothetical protein